MSIESGSNLNCVTKLFHHSTLVSSIIINGAMVDPLNSVLVDAIWIDAYARFFHPRRQCAIFICSYSKIAPNASYEFDIFMTGISEGQTVNFGVPPLAETYLTESGNVKLEVVGDNIADWKVTCIDKPFVQNYTSTPYVFISVSFRDKRMDGPVAPAIVGWVEFVNEVGFRGCVRRLVYVGPKENAFIPYLEYLVISEDGIYDPGAEFSSGKKTFVVTLELKRLSNATAFKKQIFSLSPWFTDLLALNGRLNGTVAARDVKTVPSSNYMAYAFLLYVYSSDNGSEIIDAVSRTFSDGYFPYVNSTPNLVELMKAVYPNGKPKTDDEKVEVSFWFDHSCPVGPFNSGRCSSKVCNDTDWSGMKTITRKKLTQFNSTFCPPLSIEVPCNLPPCTIKELTFFVQPPHGTDLSWLWLLIAVLAIIGITGGAYYIYTKKSKKVPFRQLR